MSAKSKKAPEPLKVTRELPEIQAEYGQLASKAGQVQYQIEVYKAELAQLNERMLKVNREAAARQQLNAEKVSVTPAPEATTTEAGT